MRRVTQQVVVVLALLSIAASGACTWSPSGTGVGNPGNGGGGGSSTSGNGGATGSGGVMMPPKMCTGLQCQQSTCKALNGCMVPACPGGGRTTVSGTISDPAGKVPLYNITVYVPNAPLADIKDGPSCDPCDPKTGTSLLSGDPIVVTKTDVKGQFTLGMGIDDVPAGTNIPLVIQVGKWRRQITLDTVTACQDNPISGDNARLPRNKNEGHIPRMALTTGMADALECLLRKVGIADSEFTTETGDGRVNLYAGGGGSMKYTAALGGGATFTGAQTFWDSASNMNMYDIVLLSCEGQQGSFNDPNGNPTFTKSMMARQNLLDFANMGGRVFASHWHVYWFERGPAPFPTIATFNHGNMLPNPFTATIDTSFPTGAALSMWMVNVMGSPAPGGTVVLNQMANMTTVAAATGGTTSQRWLYGANGRQNTVQFLSATTPIPGGSCGRVVMSDLHVSAGGGMMSDMPAVDFPSGCVTTDLSPQEKVLEFMLFDIANCIEPVVQ
jgi:hypothetical protein